MIHTPSEVINDFLRDLKEMILNEEILQDIDWCIAKINGNDVYNYNEMIDEGVLLI